MTIYLSAGSRITEITIPSVVIAAVIGGIIALVIRQLWHVDWKHFWG